MERVSQHEKRGKNALSLRQTFVPFHEVQGGGFAPLFLDYLAQKKSLTNFYNRFPTQASFEQQIREKQQSFSSTNRRTLYNVLKSQYKNLSHPRIVAQNVEMLTDSNTFTVTTGHQLNIFTGPLYVIYKIVSTINLCKQLKRSYPHFHFVPLYWMASEDHDFKEISQFLLQGKAYTWSTPQKGRVGSFDPKDMQQLLDQIPGNITLFRSAYLSHQRLSDAVRYYMNELFGGEGLVVIDADCHSLKTFLRPIIADDVFNNVPRACVAQSDKQLKKMGYSLQVHTRPINFFYVEKEIRARIERKGDDFFVQDTTLSFDPHQLREMIDHAPEKFSPNVSLRPLYQELILPNIAYVGGPAETAYWLQLKSMFDHYQVPFPILVPRNCALIVKGTMARAWKKTTLSAKDLFKTKTQLHTQWIHHSTHNNLRLEKETDALNTLFQQVETMATQIDSTLQRMVRAEAHKTQKALNKIEHRMLRSEKRKYREALRRIDQVKDTLFPEGKMQERSDNFLTFYQEDPKFIQKLLQAFDPLDFRFQLLFYPFT